MTTTDLNDDKALFSRVAAGDRDAFSTLFHRYASPLYRNAYKLLRSEFWAQELVQIVFTQLWQNREVLVNVTSPSSYLYRMVTNKALDRMRQHEREVKLQYWLEQQATLPVEAVAVEWDRRYRLLEDAVQALPPQRKKVYQLKYQQGLSYEEIAAQLSLTVHTVRNHMAKALEDIRSFLIPHADLVLLLLFFKNF